MASLALSGLAGRYGLLGPIRNMAASLLRTNTGRKFAKEGGRQLVGQALPGAAITTVLGTLTTGNPLAGLAIGLSDVALSAGAARALAGKTKAGLPKRFAGRYVQQIDPKTGRQLPQIYQASLPQNMALLAGSVAAPIVLEPMFMPDRYTQQEVQQSQEAIRPQLTQQQQVSQLAALNNLQYMDNAPGTLYQMQGLPARVQ